MITRFYADGFKNLVDFTAHFSAFNCIAGANAAGKSNLFDALQFLSNLTKMSIYEAAAKVRSEGQDNTNIRDLFTRVGTEHLNKMCFEVDMIIPQKSISQLGQDVKADITSVRYALELRYNEDEKSLEISKEELRPISIGDMTESLKFPHSKEWRKSVLTGRRSSSQPFMYTESGIVRLAGGTGGAPIQNIAAKMPYTVLSTVQASHPTAAVVKSVMASWMLLQLETSSLRQSDSTITTRNSRLSERGKHLPATVARLQREAGEQSDLLQELTNEVAKLIEGVTEISIEEDTKRDLLTLVMRKRDGSTLPARALSDGTLRFLGLAVLLLDKKTQSIICLEEPENGIHPEKIPDILDILRRIACDTNLAVDDDNPLRQVIFNTHSPDVVKELQAEDLLMAQLSNKQRLVLGVEPSSWRNKLKNADDKNLYIPLSRQKLHTYLYGRNAAPSDTTDKSQKIKELHPQQPLLFPTEP